MKRLKGESSSSSSSSECLITGLHDDVARLCLLRVPADAHKSCKRVSKRWNSIFKTKRIFSMHRKESGFQDPWLVVFAFDQQNDKIHVKVLNLATLSWHTEHTCPQLHYGRGYFKSVSIPLEGVLFAFGGVVSLDGTANAFLRFEARCEEDRWTVIKAMTGRLGKLTAGVIDGKVYVTGLDKELSDGEHAPVEVLDPKEGTWKPVVSPTGGDFDSATVFNGKLLLTYKSERGRIYDPRADKWEDMGLQLSEGLRQGGAVEIHGHLFLFVPGVDECGMRVYNAESDRWDIVEGINALPTPQGIDYGCWVSCWDGKIYVATDSQLVVVGRIIISSCSSKSELQCKFRVQWERIVDPPRSHVNLATLCAQVLI